MPIGLLAIIGFFLCVISFLRAFGGRREIPYISISLLFGPILFIGISKPILRSEFKNSLVNKEVELKISSDENVDSKVLVAQVIRNLYLNKGVSGSHPDGKLIAIELCKESHCYLYNLTQDSRDKNMYWFSFSPALGATIPLGFTRLD